MSDKDDPNSLDRKRSFGVVYGDPNIGYMQDNKPFRHDGTRFEPPAPPIPTVKPDQIVGASTVNSTHSEKMKQIWANRRAQELQDANTGR